MQRLVSIAFLILIVAATAASATERPAMVRGDAGVHVGRPIGTSKASGDTIHLIGNPANPDHADDAGIGPVENGTFEDQTGYGDWHGWTHLDNTFDPSVFWQVSDFNALDGLYSYWCGTYYEGDPGYGNEWDEAVRFRYAVEDPDATYSVSWSAILRVEVEPNYDFVYMEYNAGGVWTQLGQYDGSGTHAPDHVATFAPADLVGPAGDEIQLRIRVVSDNSWSDEDDLYDTDGACQVDDIMVEITTDGSPEASFFEDFEDMTADDWAPVVLVGVGDYAQVWSNLEDMDPCRANHSPQVAFVDDGIVVPGTGGTHCTSWCYGPSGFIVNNTGGQAGPDHYIDNLVVSPVLEWPDGAEGCHLEFTVYRHEELGAYTSWPGMFYQWHVRSVDTGDPADLADAPWVNRNFVQYGGPDYLRQHEPVADLLAPDRTHLQVSLRVIEYGYVWGWIGTDGTPAPYFDNVVCAAYPHQGPAVAGRAIDFLQDDFPASGDIDLVELGNNDIRLDAARNIAQSSHLINDPGDSMVFTATPIRAGSVLEENPRFHVRMRANPLFDDHRANVPDGFTLETDAFPDGWSLITGFVYADSAYDASSGDWVENRWEVDLPDEGFFFPGDVLKWYVEVSDNVDGDVGTTLLPADTTGFASFVYDLRYPVDFIVRGLPTIRSDTSEDQPSVLFWNDFIGRGGDDAWLFALNQLGYQLGVDYDMYATNGPTSGVGNGLGGRATSAQLSGYSTLLYTSGDLSVNLIANGDFESDPSDDITVVTSWFAQGEKNALFTGDDFVRGMRDAGSSGTAFVNTYLPVNFVQNNVRPFIEGQTSPHVSAVDGNGIISRVDAWIAHGGCPGINTFDAVEPVGSSTRIAEFTDPDGNPGAYTYAAAIYNHYAPEQADVVYLPYDFTFVFNAPGWSPPAGYGGIPARAIILEDILDIFGESGASPAIGVDDTPDAGVQVRNFPNPFNPRTTIELRLPRDGDVSLKVYNVRGELVRTLVDGPLSRGEHAIVWDGRTDAGRQAASGVYFYEARANGEVKVDKMALLK